jgi:ribosomal protein L11 methyltransferase
MKNWFYFKLENRALVSLALQELSSCRLEHISLIEDPETGECTLCGSAEEALFPPIWKYIRSHQKISPEVDWMQEWTSFCPYFEKESGQAKIPLQTFSTSCTHEMSCKKEELILLPGPGFGDLSHHTTHLSLQFLSSLAKGSVLIDLGCGSGILGLAALKWGAQFVYALDIERTAL